MSSIDWDTIELAIFTWFREGASLANNRVIWDFEDGPRPQAPYISINLSEVQAIGQDFQVYEDNPDFVGEPLTELLQKNRGIREVSISAQCFAVKGSGAVSPMSLLWDVVSSIPIHEHNLNVARVGFLSVGAVKNIGSQPSKILEPRASLEVRLSVPSELVSFTTYIERVQLTLAIEDVSKELWIPSPPEP